MLSTSSTGSIGTLQRRAVLGSPEGPSVYSFAASEVQYCSWKSRKRGARAPWGSSPFPNSIRTTSMWLAGLAVWCKRACIASLGGTFCAAGPVGWLVTSMAACNAQDFFYYYAKSSLENWRLEWF